MMRLNIPGLAALLVSLWSIVGQAATLEELESRQREMRQDLKAVEDRLARLETTLNSQGLLNLLNQINELKMELARLRGLQEEQLNAINQSDRRQKELFEDLDSRLKDLASRPVAAPVEPVKLQASPALLVSPQEPQSENKAYEAALGHFRSGDYRAAVTALQAFIKEYPSGSLASNAHYWLGLAYASLGDHASAVQVYQKLLKEFPSSNKVPDAMVSLARAHIQLGELASAQALLEQVVAKHAQSRAAENARKLLTTLK